MPTPLPVLIFEQVGDHREEFFVRTFFGVGGVPMEVGIEIKDYGNTRDPFEVTDLSHYGMTPDQAERLGRQLLDMAQRAREHNEEEGL